MKITLFAHGLRGDVWPSVALGRRLSERGHDVAIAVPGEFRSFAECAGLRVIPLPFDMVAWLSTADGQRLLQGGRLPLLRALGREYERHADGLDDAAIEALVASGLDTINLSIDGATQATYEQYRKRGNLQLALDNARRLVAAKRRQQTAAPHLYWRYLDFPWNRHEIEMARQLARDIGVDEFGVEPGIMSKRTKYSKSSRPIDEVPLQCA